jgi:hypothetical protein
MLMKLMNNKFLIEKSWSWRGGILQDVDTSLQCL